jgi:hypothetical protein
LNLGGVGMGRNRVFVRLRNEHLTYLWFMSLRSGETPVRLVRLSHESYDCLTGSETARCINLLWLAPQSHRINTFVTCRAWASLVSQRVKNTTAKPVANSLGCQKTARAPMTRVFEIVYDRVMRSALWAVLRLLMGVKTANHCGGPSVAKSSRHYMTTGTSQD